MNSILECSQRNGRARAVFGEETMRFCKMFLYTLLAFFQNGEKASAGIMRKSNARMLVVGHE